MNLKSPRYRLLALGLLFSCLVCAFWGYPTIRDTLVALSACSYVAALVAWFIEYRNRDPYSLEALREIMIEGTYDESDVPEVDENGDSFCMCCGTVYGRQFGVCPTCAKKGK